MSESKVGAVVLATRDTGFGNPVEFGGDPPALVEVGGEPMVARVVRAAADAASVGVVVLIGGDDALGADQHIPTTGDAAADMAAGLAALDGCRHALVVPGNIPFTRGAEIEAFICAANDGSTQVAYPLVTKQGCEASFPELRRTYFRLSEGELTGGNALFVDVPTFLADPEIIGKAAQLRREPWKLATMVNPLVLLKFNSGKMGCRDIGDLAQKALGLRAAVVPINAPGLATDIQKPLDLNVARKRLG